tara:strand:- start:877 stop:1065 length:189 start_codon:yes stop_codon:yes gene_type:complete
LAHLFAQHRHDPLLQKTVQGMLNEGTADTAISVTEAEFTKFGDYRDFWTERIEACEEELELT